MQKQELVKRKGDVPLWIIMILLTVAVTALALLALCVGRYSVDPWQAISILISNVLPTSQTWESTDYRVVMLLRFPRIIAAMLVGAALALSGATYQGIFKNPLVSPDLLGVSAGSCVGAALAIVIGLNNLGTQFLAFIGGLLAVLLTLSIPALVRRSSTIMLVLAGVVVGGFMNSLIGLLKYVADTETQLPEIAYWMLGSISKVTLGNLKAVAPVIIITGGLLIAARWRINVLSLGDNEARTIGVNLRVERGLAILCATLLTACSVCISGTIVWLGLIMPHLARMLVGSNHTRLLPVTAMLGAGFLLIVDTLARTLTGGEIPLGILTGLIGTPFFAFVLIKRRMSTE